MTTLLRASAACALVLMAPAASAQDFYGSVFGGYAQLDDPSFDGTIGGSANSVEVESDDGFGFGIAVGKTFGQFGSASIRGEVELSYSDNDATDVFFSGNGDAAEVNIDGAIETSRLFANVYADFETASAFTPYVGVGLGVSRSELDVSYGPGVVLDDESDNTSAQLIAGASYALNDAYSLFGDVRYIRDFDVSTDRLSPAGDLTGTISDDVNTVSINLGVSYNF